MYYFCTDFLKSFSIVLASATSAVTPEDNIQQAATSY